VALIIAGYGDKDIARDVSLSASTIHRRIVRITAKLGVCNKLELVLFAIDHRLVNRSANHAA
jgi:DNA-binding NarL/FixJ family response regulator